jgi:thioredoxin-like negative regulator of GroEL
MKTLFVAAALVALAFCAPARAQEPAHDVAWTRDFAGGLKLAQKTGKPVLLDFSATWCGPCREMEHGVWPDSKVVGLSQKYVCISVDIDSAEYVAARYRANEIPTIVLADPFGNQISRHTGYMGAAELSDFLDGFPADFTPAVEAIAASDANSNDVDAHMSVASFYAKLGAADMSRKYYERALKAGPLKTDAKRREEVFIAVGLSYLKANDANGARKIFDRCMKECPDGPRHDLALLGLCTAQLRQNKQAEAEKTLAELKAKYPDSPATAQAAQNIAALHH